MPNYGSISISNTQPTMETLALNSVILGFRLFYIILTTILIVAGNSLVLYVIYRNRKLHNATGIFMANIAICDFVIALETVIAIASLVRGNWIFEEQKTSCAILGFLIGIAVLHHVYVLLLMSIERYIYLSKPLKYYRIVSNKRTAIFLVVSLTVSMLIHLPYPAGLTGFAYDPVIGICLMDMKKYEWFVLFRQLIGPVFCFVIISVFYYKIHSIAKAHKHGSTLGAFPESNQNGNSRELNTNDHTDSKSQKTSATEDLQIYTTNSDDLNKKPEEAASEAIEILIEEDGKGSSKRITVTTRDGQLPAIEKHPTDSVSSGQQLRRSISVFNGTTLITESDHTQKTDSEGHSHSKMENTGTIGKPSPEDTEDCTSKDLNCSRWCMVASFDRCTKTVLLIVGVYFLTWLPFTVLSLVNMFVGAANQTSEHVWFCIKWLVLSNAYMNPFIYMATDERFKHEIRDFRKRCCKMLS